MNRKLVTFINQYLNNTLLVITFHTLVDKCKEFSVHQSNRHERHSQNNREPHQKVGKGEGKDQSYINFAKLAANSQAAVTIGLADPENLFYMQAL